MARKIVKTSFKKNPYEEARVRCFMEFLTWGTKLASFYQKSVLDSRKLLSFVKRHSLVLTKIGHNFRK